LSYTSKLKKQTSIFFYALSAYVIIQFIWWGYHLIELTQALDVDDKIVEKRITMVVGEGFVFIVLLLIGLWKIRSSVRKEFELSQQQNNFLLSVTHELKTPIAANKLYLQTIQKRKPDDVQREELLAKAIKENERLEKLIDNILHAARVENRAMQPITEEIEVSHFLQSLIQQSRKRYPDAQIDLLEMEKITWFFDVFMIETVMSNLIDNAVKYSSESPKITVSAQLELNELMVSVIDQGVGVSELEQKRIFSKFYRVGNEEIRTQKGSGLGLFISREFIKLHRGSIGYKPNKDKGSIFYFKLPI
jgi:K+-sensing histidine kinase KdpD